MNTNMFGDNMPGNATWSYSEMNMRFDVEDCVAISAGMISHPGKDCCQCSGPQPF